MKNMFRLAVIFIFLSAKVWAANDNYPFGGRAAGMANAAVSLYDFWAVSHNQAGLATLQHPAAGVYFENRFLARELSLGALAFAYPTNSGVLAFSFTYFGFELYNESKTGVAFARQFGDRFSAGVQLNYQHIGIAYEYGTKGNFTFELGAIFEIIPDLYLGTHIFNPTRARIAEFADERIPTIIRNGISYHFSEKVIIAIEAEKSVNLDPVFKAGAEYNITDQFYIRAGIGTNPATNSFGFGMKQGKVNIDIATSHHYVLGYSPQLSFIYHLR